jgi:hypothetical protein
MWFLNVATKVPFTPSHSFMLLSKLADSTQRPSGLKVTYSSSDSSISSSSDWKRKISSQLADSTQRPSALQVTCNSSSSDQEQTDVLSSLADSGH